MRKKPRRLRAEPLEERRLLASLTGSPVQNPPTSAALVGPQKPPPANAAQTAVRSLDGTGNNQAHPEWGSAGSTFLRKGPAAYGDGVSSPAGGNRPSARVISNALFDQGGLDILSGRQLSAMAYAWGQFIDHDMDLTLTNGQESLPIAVPKGDPWFDPQGTGTQTIPLTRSQFNPATGTSATNPRQQLNSITSFLDASMVYGSDATTAAALRTFSGGHLKTSAGNLLPVDSASGMFQAGDIRANENVELISLQTLFVREHNYWADKLAAAKPGSTDEQLYQQARQIVGAEIQAITYNQWLPAILGPGALAPYKGYNPNVNPGIANEFATAGFRFGHSLLGDDVEFLDNDGNEIRPAISLREAFFNPDLVKQTGIEPLLKYLSEDQASEMDTKVVDSVRNFLFGEPGQGGLDLVSLNIQRGRDHGLADYNSVRAAYGLPKVKDFSQITSDAQLAQKLKELYGNVNNIDLWVGALAEDHVRDAAVGPTLRAILADQFQRLRDGDRFWYQRTLSGDLLKQVEQTTLSDIMQRSSLVRNLQRNVFFIPEAPQNQTQTKPGSGPTQPSGGQTQRPLASAPDTSSSSKTNSGAATRPHVSAAAADQLFAMFSGTLDELLAPKKPGGLTSVRKP